ncbi:MAG: KxYKxGKxW signal peptide domain-containing protein [Oscillospiraceae bacterium]|nr:KxYKxGKxW signal peptide domain-containing protein [Oscillospiraceae bacterium]
MPISPPSSFPLPTIKAGKNWAFAMAAFISTAKRRN